MLFVAGLMARLPGRRLSIIVPLNQSGMGFSVSGFLDLKKIGNAIVANINADAMKA
jgi:hypothetical protein